MHNRTVDGNNSYGPESIAVITVSTIIIQIWRKIENKIDF